jgi:dihydroflavonol-4-reductase
MDSAFVTGGTGFLGANLVRLLLEKGLRVKALARKGSDRRNLEGLTLDIVEGDLSDTAALEKGCSGSRYVFHLAADYRIWAANPKELYTTNVGGTQNVLKASRAAGVERVIHCSSVATIRPSPHRIAVGEDSVYRDESDIVGDYKKSKFLAEALAAAREGAPGVIVNPSAPIGPWDRKPTPTGRMVVDFLAGRMPSYIDTGLNVVHAADAAWGHYLAALRGKPGERYILGGENLTLKDILLNLAEITGLQAPRFKTPYSVAYLYGALDTAFSRMTGAEPRVALDAVKMARYYMWFDSAKAVRELGYAVSSARRALSDSVAWFVKNGYARVPTAA